MGIIYDPASFTITVTEGTEETANKSSDLYDADKAGTLQLLAPTSAGPDLSLTRQVQPADDKALKLNIIISNFSVAGDVVLTGKDKDGNAQDEIINITGNGTYVTTRWFKSIDAAGIDCTGTYTIEITESRWGVGHERENVRRKHYDFDCRIFVGDGSTLTWFIDDSGFLLNKYSYHLFTVKNNARLRLGQLLNATEKTTTRGCALYNVNPNLAPVYVVSGGKAELYGCLLGSYYYGTSRGMLLNYGELVLYNCILSGINLMSLVNSTLEIYRTTIYDAYYALRLEGESTIEDLIIANAEVAIIFTGPITRTLKNVKIRNCGTAIRCENTIFSPQYFVNPDVDVWSLLWVGVNFDKLHRQYEFDTHCQDKDKNNLSGVTAVGEYISPYGQAFSESTDGNGNIPTLTVDHGFFDSAHGSTEQLKTPLKVTYSKPGYQTVVKYYDMIEKTKDVVVLHKAVGTFVDVGGKPVVNLRKSNPENNRVMVL